MRKSAINMAMFIMFFCKTMAVYCYDLKIENNFYSHFIGNKAELAKDPSCIAIDGNVHTLEKTLIWESLKEKRWKFWKADKCYWFRFGLENATDTVRPLNIEVTNFQIDYLDFFVVDEEGKIIQSEFTGNKRGFNSRVVYDRNFLFNLNLAANQKVEVYFHTRPQGQLLSFPITVWAKEKKFLHSQSMELSKGILFGVLILFFFVAMYLSALVKSLNYFLYGLHVMMGTFYYFVSQGIAFEFFWSNNPKIQIIISNICLQLYFLSSLVFIFYFLKRRLKGKIFFDILRILMFATLVFILFNIFLHYLPFSALQIFLFVQSLYILIATLLLYSFIYLAWRRVEDKFLVIISMSFFFGYSILIYNPVIKTFFPPNSYLFQILVSSGGWLLAILIAVLIIFRSGSVVKASRKIKDQMGGLNKKYGYFLLEGGEKERKRVSEELHDGIGIGLSTLKLKLSLLMSETENVTLIRNIGPLLKDVDKACDEVRILSHQLREQSLDRFGLEIAIKDFLEELNLKYKRKYVFRHNIQKDRLTKISESTIFRMIQGLILPIWEMQLENIELRVIIFYSTEKATLKIDTQGVSFNIDSPAFNDFRNILEVLHGSIKIDRPTAFINVITADFPLLVNE